MPEEDQLSRAVLRASGAHLVVADRNGHIVLCSEAFRLRAGLGEHPEGLLAHATGYPAGSNLIPPSPFLDVDSLAFPNESWRFWGRPLGGMHWRNTALRGSDGRLTHVIGVGTDSHDQPWIRREVLKISEQERRRIGQDLHDGIGQFLAGIALLGTELASSLAEAHRPEAPLALELVSLARRGDSEVRHLARGLMPLSFQSGGLAEALSLLAADVERLFRIPCVLDIDPDLPDQEDQTASDLYHIAQEAVNNAMKHAAARRLDVSLRRSDAHVELSVCDDGNGFASGDASDETGLGLRIMRYRALRIGGELEIISSPGAGTRVACRVPLGVSRPTRAPHAKRKHTHTSR